jgi:hypothetical protein
MPDTGAVRAALERCATGAPTVVAPDRWPDRSRVLTVAGHGGREALVDVERRAGALLDERRAEFAEWAARELDRLDEQLRDVNHRLIALTEALATIDSRATAADAATRSAQDAHANALRLATDALAELRARDDSLTWRMRTWVLRMPGVGAAIRRVRRSRT